MGRWEDVVLGIWWCPDCGEESWPAEGMHGDVEGQDAGVRRSGSRGAALPVVRAAAPDGGDVAGASRDRAPGDGVGWRDRDGGALLWHLIVDAFGRAAE